MDREFHPVANIFPLMAESEIAAMADDILSNGLREAIWTDDDGKIIDGRNRFLACQQVRVTPEFRVWDGKGSLIAFVVSLNLKRRHLNESQRSAVGAEIANLQKGANQHTDKSASSISQKDAAAMLNVSVDSIQNAKTVLEHGTPEEIQAVKQGTAAVTTIAKQIRKKTPKEIRKAKRGEPVSSRGKNPERIQAMQLRAAVWGQIRDALTNLTSLPAPSEVAAFAREHDKTGLVDARLNAALNWLKEFSHEWSNRDKAQAGAKAGDHHLDARNGNRAA